MKNSLRINIGDDSLMKKIQAKCVHKDKDKSSTLDSYNNTKSTLALKAKLNNISGINVCTETTPSSQILCDLSYKEYSQLRASTPKINAVHEKQGSPTTSRASPKTRKLRGLEILKMPEFKDLAILNLEKARMSVGDEIDQAVDYFSKNRDFNSALDEKDRKIKELTALLEQKSKEVERLESSKKFRSTPNILDNSKCLEYRFSRQDDRTQNSSVFRVTSLSPRFNDLSLQKQEKYKMYTENVHKNSSTKLTKPKTPRGRVPQFPLSTIVKQQKKYTPYIPNSASVVKTEGSAKPRKSCLVNPRLRTPSPKKRVIFKIKNPAETARHQQEDERESIKGLGMSMRNIKQDLKLDDSDLSKSYNVLLSQFVTVIEKYKNTTKTLYQKNKDLEKKIQKFDKLSLL